MRNFIDSRHNNPSYSSQPSKNFCSPFDLPYTRIVSIERLCDKKKFRYHNVKVSFSVPSHSAEWMSEWMESFPHITEPNHEAFQKLRLPGINFTEIRVIGCQKLLHFGRALWQILNFYFGHACWHKVLSNVGGLCWTKSFGKCQIFGKLFSIHLYTFLTVCSHGLVKYFL